MQNFSAAVVDYSYMFRLLQSNNHQAEYQMYKKEIILRVGYGGDLGLTSLLHM